MRLGVSILSFFALGLVVGFGSTAKAEKSAQARTYVIHAYGGFSFGVDQGEVAGDVSRANGLAFGLGFDYRVLPQIYLSFEVLNLVKGHNARVNGVISQYQLTYVSVPVQIKYAPIPQFNFHAGPYLASLLVSAIQEQSGSFAGVKNQFRNDFGLTAGIWFGFQAGSVLNLGMDIRYDHGLANIQADGDPSTSISTRALIFMGSISFSFD